MSDLDEVLAVVERWMSCMDAGDLDGMLACCDPEVVIANERQPTTVGVDPVRTKYADRLAKSDTKSTFDAEHSAVYDNFAIVIGHFQVDATDKMSGDARVAAGRLTMAFRKDRAGDWKLILDVDNN